MKPVSFHCSYRIEWDDVAIFALVKDANGVILETGKPVEWQPYLRGTASAPEPTMAISHQEAGALINALWDAGFRPRNVGSAGELGATQRHLADMRTIAFSKIGITDGEKT
jgi:hypothetical protein